MLLKKLNKFIEVIDAANCSSFVNFGRIYGKQQFRGVKLGID